MRSCVIIASLVLALWQHAVAAEQPKVLILLADGFNCGEHYETYLPLKARGYAIDIASFQAGTVHVNKEGEPDRRGRDVQANLALSQVDDIGAYAALALPGGYSPGKLEKDPAAVEICRRFLIADKPVAAVCHGPRLLARTGLLEGRMATSWHQVSSEIAQVWEAGACGVYVDQPVVIDGQIVTSRYPGDMQPWMHGFLTKLGQAGHLGPLTVKPRVVLIVADYSDGHQRWALKRGLSILGVDVLVAHDAKAAAKLVADGKVGPELVDVILRLPGAKGEALMASAEGQALIKAIGERPLVALPAQDDYTDHLPGMLAAALEHAREKVAVVESDPDAYIAVEHGFDGTVVAALQAHLAWKGKSVAIVAHETGWVRGLHGMPVEASLTYADAVADKTKLVIAPGGLWPTHGTNIRDVENLEALEAQGRRDAARLAWFLAQYDTGATLVTVGFDSLRIGKQPVFKGKKFASSDQTVWSFGKAGGRYSRDPVLQTDTRIFSAKGSASLPALFTLLDAHLRPTTAAEGG